MASSATRAPERAKAEHGRAEPETHLFADDGVFPNSRLPVLIYRGVLETPDAAVFEQMFEANGWSSAWRNGLYSVHHYHSTAHEVLGIYGGRVTARLGGGQGTSVTLVAGDVVVIPAGTGHWFTKIDDHIDYLMVRIDPDKVTPLKSEAQSQDYLSKPAKKGE